LIQPSPGGILGTGAARSSGKAGTASADTPAGPDHQRPKESKMAEQNVTIDPTDRAAAAGDVFSYVASDLWFAVRTLHQAVGDNDSDAVLAAIALVAQAGAMADDAAQALGSSRIADKDDWHRSDIMQAKLAALTAASAEGAAA
jgi:hypothetical protein